MGTRNRWAAMAIVAAVAGLGGAERVWGQGPTLVGPAQIYVPAAPVTTYYSTTATAMYPPVTIWNWWRPRPVVAYYGTTAVAPPAVVPAMPAAAAPTMAYYPPATVAAPTMAYYPPAAAAPTTAYYPPVAASAPVTAYYGAPAPVAVAPTVVYRPIVAPPQAYLYSRGPLGFPRLDPVPAAPLVPVVIPAP
ncbi:MAG: hypothetical protein U0935_18445 [Pirellulales bacterium]